MNGGKRRKYVADQLYSIRKAGHIMCTLSRVCGTGGWVGGGMLHDERSDQEIVAQSMFNELLVLSKSWSLRETTFLNQSPVRFSVKRYL